jgi:acid phosphatase (class A)
MKTLLFAVALPLLLTGCASHGVADASSTVPEIGHGFLMGYVDKDVLPDSLALLPAPPASGTAAYALDQAFAKQTFALRDTPRWALARTDADLGFPQAATVFACALGVRVGETSTPRLYQLLRRTLTDAGLSTYRAKDKYQRARPFMVNEQSICTENEREFLLKDGSYPSGHTAIGWAWALILAEMSPAQADAVLARGLAYGESRNICNVHWHSDVQQGLVIGAAAVARVHAEPDFQRDFVAAQAELAAARANGSATPDDCESQAAALAKSVGE